MGTIRISSQFNGPPNSANGGYICGLIDKQTSYISEVTLRSPPPWEADLSFEEDEGHLVVKNKKVLIATCKPGLVDIIVPVKINFEEALSASNKFVAYEDHIFPTCFVCGPSRAKQDGLSIFPGRVDDTDVYAAPWIPDLSFANSNGHVKEEVVWASLDCPGAFSIMGDTFKPMVLGRMTTSIKQPVIAGEKHILIAWPLGTEGKKHFCGTAVLNNKNEVVALAKSTWISIDSEFLK